MRIEWDRGIGEIESEKERKRGIGEGDILGVREGEKGK